MEPDIGRPEVASHVEKATQLKNKAVELERAESALHWYSVHANHSVQGGLSLEFPNHLRGHGSAAFEEALKKEIARQETKLMDEVARQFDAEAKRLCSEMRAILAG